MKRCEKNAGFTLVELLVTITAASIVMIAVSSILLLGMRVNRLTLDSASQRQNVRTVLKLAENLGSSGTEIKNVLKFDEDTHTIRTAGDGVLLKNVSSFDSEPAGSGLMTISIIMMDGKSYKTSIYCRTGTEPTPPAGGSGEAGRDVVVDEIAEKLGLDADLHIMDDSPIRAEAGAEARTVLLETLLSQYGSGGWIIGGDGIYNYYSEWYIGGYRNGWGRETPWCACFLSWAAARLHAEPDGPAPRFADVDKGKAWFRESGQWEEPETYIPLPGDYIFFDWNCGGDPGHVGAVLHVEGNTVYTIEGNSGNRVTVREYALDSPQIVGYGVLP